MWSVLEGLVWRFDWSVILYVPLGLVPREIPFVTSPVGYLVDISCWPHHVHEILIASSPKRTSFFSITSSSLFVHNVTRTHNRLGEPVESTLSHLINPSRRVTSLIPPYIVHNKTRQWSTLQGWEQTA